MTMSQNAIFRLATTVFGEDQKEAMLWLERLDGLKSLEEGELDRLEEERKQNERLEE